MAVRERPITRKTERRAEIEAIRQRFATTPGRDELIDSGEIDEPVPHGQFIELAALVRDLKAERERQGLSLTDVAEASRLTRAMVSRLENGWNTNPTQDTLHRYALALGMRIGMQAVRIENMTPSEPDETSSPEQGDASPSSGSSLRERLNRDRAERHERRSGG